MSVLQTPVGAGTFDEPRKQKSNKAFFSEQKGVLVSGMYNSDGLQKIRLSNSHLYVTIEKGVRMFSHQEQGRWAGCSVGGQE